jgi:hypothetical protein
MTQIYVQNIHIYGFQFIQNYKYMNYTYNQNAIKQSHTQEGNDS